MNANSIARNCRKSSLAIDPRALRHSELTEDAVSSELLRELRALPLKQAAALVLRHLNAYTNRQIAYAQGVLEQNDRFPSRGRTSTAARESENG